MKNQTGVGYSLNTKKCTGQKEIIKVCDQTRVKEISCEGEVWWETQSPRVDLHVTAFTVPGQKSVHRLPANFAGWVCTDFCPRTVLSSLH